MTLTEANAGTFESLAGTDLSNLGSSLSNAALPDTKNGAKTRSAASRPPQPRSECRPVAAGGMFAALHPECSQEYLERFQFLRTELMLHRTRVTPTLDFCTLAVMSTRKGEGKSFTATNLASTLAACSGQGVLLVDANPEGAELPLGVDVLKGGLTQALTEPGKWEQSIHSVKDSTLCVMPRGRAAGRPMDFSQLPALLGHMRKQFEWVILDGASFATSPDAEWLSSVADGTLLVTQGGTVQFDAFQHSLVKVPEGRLVGVVFNERKQPTPSFRVRLRFSGKWLPSISRG